MLTSKNNFSSSCSDFFNIFIARGCFVALCIALRTVPNAPEPSVLPKVYSFVIGVFLYAIKIDLSNFKNFLIDIYNNNNIIIFIIYIYKYIDYNLINFFNI